MQRIFLLFLLLLASFEKAESQIDYATTLRMQDTIDHLLKTYKYKGLSVAVRVRDLGDWNYAAGLSDPNQPLQTDMMIGIGSNTKTFLAASFLKLVASGILSLEDSVGKWLQPLANVKGSITIRQLLNHTSGLYNYTQNPALGDSVNAKPGYIWSKLELVNKFNKAKLYNPGVAWYYSNTNYLVAGLIAEAASGVPIHKFIRDSILTPLGLQNTFFPPHEQVVPPFAQIWTNMGSGYLQSMALPTWFYSLADAAGAMVSDAADNCKFWEHLGKGDIISKDLLVNEMMKWVNTPTGKYGLGLFRAQRFGYPYFSHGGSILGQLNENLLDTLNGFSISVLSNQDSISPDRVVYGLYRILLSTGFYTSISEGNLDLELNPYPNPAKEFITLSGEAGSEVEIYGVHGTLVKKIKIENNNKIFIGDLPQGLYLLQSDQEGKIKRGRVIKDF
jgi:D-alanyl-D-alanine carboxypeptidase